MPVYSFITVGILDGDVDIMKLLRRGETACRLETDHAKVVFDTTMRLCERLRVLEREEARPIPHFERIGKHIREAAS